MKSDLYIYNNGNIGRIHNGIKSNCYIGYSKKGNIGKVSGGHVKKLNIVSTYINRIGNGVVFNMNLWSKVAQGHLDDIMDLNKDGIDYLNQQVTNLYAFCKMSTFDIVMNTGESIDAWFQRYMTADEYKKTDMIADLIAEGIRIGGSSYALTKLGKVFKGGVIEGASYASKGGVSLMKYSN